MMNIYLFHNKILLDTQSNAKSSEHHRWRKEEKKKKKKLTEAVTVKYTQRDNDTHSLSHTHIRLSLRGRMNEYELQIQVESTGEQVTEKRRRTQIQKHRNGNNFYHSLWMFLATVAATVEALSITFVDVKLGEAKTTR